MNFQTVPTASIVGMAISAIFTLVLVIFLFMVGWKKFGAKPRSFALGCITFFVMALVLEKLLHAILLGNQNSPTYEFLTGNVWMYGLYGALCAAVFEEVGRYFVMKKFMKKDMNFENGFMYGIGHGGIEAIMVLTITQVSNIAMSTLINSGEIMKSFEGLDESQSELLFNQLSILWETESYMYYAGIFERIFAIVLQVALSLVMYQCVKLNKKSLFAIAFVTHFLMDFCAVILTEFAPIIVVELFIAAFAVVMLFYARNLEKKYSIEE